MGLQLGLGLGLQLGLALGLGLRLKTRVGMGPVLELTLGFETGAKYWGRLWDMGSSGTEAGTGAGAYSSKELSF